MEFTHRVMAKTSKDGRWILGIASDNATGISFNLNPNTGCIHQNPFWGKLKAGEEKQTHVRVYLIKGALDDLWDRYLADFAEIGQPARSDRQPTR